MSSRTNFSRRDFLAATGLAAGGLAFFGRPRFALAAAQTPHADMAALRQALLDAPVGVALHRAQVFTKVFQQHEAEAWIVRKALALRAYFETVPLYLR